MGCTCSVGRLDEDSPRVFKVINVDDHGQERNPGKIEITESELIWYQKNKEPIRWPLRSLRRYGFDAELFSFESGRRCPTGQGIYAFKCRRAEALFNLLQECIQRQRTGTFDEPHRNHVSPLVGGGTQLITLGTSEQGSRPASVVDLPLTSTNSRTGSPHMRDYVNGELRGHEYVNTDLHVPGSTASSRAAADPQAVVVNVQGASSGNSTSEPLIQYAVLDLPKPGGEDPEDGASSHNGHCVHADISSQQATYINIPPNDIKLSAGAARAGSRGSTSSASGGAASGPSYANLDIGSHRSANKLGLRLHEPQLPKGKYVQLDLKGSSDNLSTGGGGAAAAGTAAGTNPSPASPSSMASSSESPTRKTESYATIDFDRTRALNSKSAMNEDEGYRKTRHNSNIDDIVR